MNKKFVLNLIRLIAVFTVVVFSFALFACDNADNTDYPSMIDDGREYTEVEITSEQKTIAKFCRIENYFVLGDFKIVRVISEQGYVDEIELLVLLEGTTVKQIKGLNVKETADYGAKCFNDKFISQFYGIDLLTSPLLRGRQDNFEDGEILYVSHATTTSRALISAVNAVALFIKDVQK